MDAMEQDKRLCTDGGAKGPDVTAWAYVPSC